MRWLPSWWKRKKAAAATRMVACPTWAAWAAWTCNAVVDAVEERGPGNGPSSFLRLGIIRAFPATPPPGQVAQLVEQRTENPCVGGSIPPLATMISREAQNHAGGLS